MRREIGKAEAAYEKAHNEKKGNEKSGEFMRSTRLENIRAEFNEA